MRRSAALILALAALAATGCGGSNQHAATPPKTTPAPTPSRPLTQLDLVNIIGLAPDTPAGASYTANQAETLTLGGLPSDTRAERATVRTFRRAGFRQIYQRSYNGPLNAADGTAYLFRTAAGGARGFAVLKATLSKPAAVSQRVTAVSAAGLGQESWAAHLTGDSEGALFLWRRGTLVVVADMSCDSSCGLDIVGAARAYAKAIDQRAAQTP